MTVFYFVRHADTNYNNHDDVNRELTQKGLRDRQLVTNFLSDKNIGIVLSSPYKRAVDTIKDFSDKYNLPIQIIEDFRERKVDDVWIEDFAAFCQKQWCDFSYKLPEGESLGEVQARNIQALKKAIKEYSGKNIVVGSHGTALSTIIHYFDNTFDYERFVQIRYKMPWIVKFTFDDETLQSIEEIDLFRI